MTVNVGKWIEPVLYQIKDILTTGITTKLAAIKATHSNDMTIEDPREYHIGKTSIVQSVPAIMIYPDSDNGSRWTNESFVMDLNVIVAVVCFDTHPETLQKMLWRYQQAIIELLQPAGGTTPTGSLNGQVDLCEFNGLRFAGPWEDKGYSGAAGVLFRIQNEETV